MSAAYYEGPTAYGRQNYSAGLDSCVRRNAEVTRGL